MNAVSISYCTTCKGRLHQLRETLAGNLATLQADEEIVLVDFNSPDGVAAWVWDNFRSDIERGALRFFEVLDEAPWHAAKAKNLAHRLARGSFVFNLDGDNFLLPEDAGKIRAAAAAGLACRQGSGNLRDGTPGRIGLSRAVFLELGGYDEGLLGALVEDVDLIIRAEAIGQRFMRLGAPARLPLQNDAAERLAQYVREEAGSADVLKRLGQANLTMAQLRREFDGPRRRQNFASYRGRLGGVEVIFDGLGNVHSAV
jgi:hypothetical protein